MRPLATIVALNQFERARRLDVAPKLARRAGGHAM